MRFQNLSQDGLRVFNCPDLRSHVQIGVSISVKRAGLTARLEACRDLSGYGNGGKASLIATTARWLPCRSSIEVFPSSLLICHYCRPAIVVCEVTVEPVMPRQKINALFGGTRNGKYSLPGNKTVEFRQVQRISDSRCPIEGVYTEAIRRDSPARGSEVSWSREPGITVR